MATRVERVVLELEDNLSTGMVNAAAKTALLKRELSGLDGTNTKTAQSTRAVTTENNRLSESAVRGTNSIDRYSGRFALLGQAALTLGPALIPIGAVGIPAVAGLATELGIVVLGAGTAVLAFHGLGTALGALNKAALNPTVTNLNAAQLALDALPPAARSFARELETLMPSFERARQAAAGGLFPGLTAGLDDLKKALPQIDEILFRVGDALGQLGKEGAQALSGPQGTDFLNFIEREAPRALLALGHSLGSVLHGFAQLAIAFTPLNNDFLGWIQRAADGFDRWATGLQRTQGFRDFINYLHQTGPQVADAVAAIGNAVVKIVEAAAPLGGPVLAALTGVSNAIAAIAGSDVGTPIYAAITALLLLGRAQSAYGTIAERSWAKAIIGAQGYSAKLSAARPQLIKGGVALAAVGIAASGVASKVGLANTATGALIGSFAGPWGAAIGGAVGLLVDLGTHTKEQIVTTDDLTTTLNKQTGAITQNTRAYVAQSLQTHGVFDAARSAGVGLHTLTSAALGNATAIARVNTELDAYQLSIRGDAQAGGDFVDAHNKILDAIEGTNSALGDARSKFSQVDRAVGGVAHSFTIAKTNAEIFRDEVNRVTDTLAHRSSLRDYQQALDDFAKSVKKNGETLDITSQKGRDNQAALDAIANSALALSQQLSASDRRTFLTQARKDFVDATTKIKGSRQAAEQLANQLGLLDQTRVRPRVYVDGIPKSLAELESVAARLRALHNRTVTVTVAHATGGRLVGDGSADGGTIGGAPRNPYGDKVMRWLAPGEEVISNRHGQADRHRTLLKAINAGMANGGTVTRTVGASASIDYGRMASSLEALRPAPPLYGDVTVHGGGEAFYRQMRQDAAMASISGVRRAA